jgi:methionyl-tRNA synthetase
MPKFYLTTPIYYVNARPHIGHAYSTIVADVLARRHRLLGDDTYFLTGTDEHGQKIERAAAAAGIPPQQYADQVSKTFSDLWSRMGITHDQFIRTTDPNHKRGVQKLFTDLYEKGQIYLSSYTGQYSVGEEMFVEGPPGTIGPDGRPTETVTEENFFFRLSDFQLPLLNLIESNELQITPDSSRNEVLAFLRGNVQNAEQIKFEIARKSTAEQAAYYQAANVPGSSLSFSHAGEPYVPGALRDLSISRSSFTWGIPVPEEIQAKEKTKEKHVIYVWLDALTNYMTALGYGSPDDTLWQKFWPADLHLVGKEITRFHCVYWPAFLLALNPRLQHARDEPTPILSPEEHAEWAKKWLPKQVTANGWLLFDNSKMSKSKGNVVRTETILDAFGTLCPLPPKSSAPAMDQKSSALATDQVAQGFSLGSHTEEKESGALAPEGMPSKADRDLFASDILRYYLLREIPFGQDGSFSFDSMITRYNADLANGYGNLVSRTLTMIKKFFDGVVPAPPESRRAIISEGAEEAATVAGISFANSDFSKTLSTIQTLISITDIELSAAAPWKSGPDEMMLGFHRSSILYAATESIRIITVLLYPFLPYATTRVWEQLGLADTPLTTNHSPLTTVSWGGLKPGTKLGPLAPIFPRADKGLAQIMTDLENQDSKLNNSKLETQQTPSSLPTSPLQAVQTPTTDPAAGPRTASLKSPDGTTGPLPVGGSTATTTRTGPTPSHTEAHASGIFANPLTTDHSPLTTSSEITIDDFTKIELRVAQITLAERIPKADKLLRLEVDLGPLGTRQILSGIAEFYAPEDLLHRKIVVITNLAPRKMRGFESHGMLLAASDGDGGKPILATFSEDIPNGTRLK